MNEHILTQRIHKAKELDRVALIPFITAGFPDMGSFWKHLGELDKGGADIIEIGVPFSDPVADSPMVEAASLKAIENGVTLSWILSELKKRKDQYQAALVLVGYYNPFLQYGLDRFAEDAAEAGVSGCIVPDLPIHEAAHLRQTLEKHGLAFIPLIGVNTSRERMDYYAENTNGYAYLMPMLRSTEVKDAFPAEFSRSFNQAEDAFKVPVVIGLGISEPGEVAAMPIKPQAVVFSSALLKHINSGQSAASFMQRWN